MSGAGLHMLLLLVLCIVVAISKPTKNAPDSLLQKARRQARLGDYGQLCDLLCESVEEESSESDDSCDWIDYPFDGTYLCEVLCGDLSKNEPSSVKTTSRPPYKTTATGTKTTPRQVSSLLTKTLASTSAKPSTVSPVSPNTTESSNPSTLKATVSTSTPLSPSQATTKVPISSSLQPPLAPQNFVPSSSNPFQSASLPIIDSPSVATASENLASSLSQPTSELLKNEMLSGTSDPALNLSQGMILSNPSLQQEVFSSSNGGKELTPLPLAMGASFDNSVTAIAPTLIKSSNSPLLSNGSNVIAEEKKILSVEKTNSPAANSSHGIDEDDENSEEVDGVDLAESSNNDEVTVQPSATTTPSLKGDVLLNSSNELDSLSTSQELTTPKVGQNGEKSFLTTRKPPRTPAPDFSPTPKLKFTPPK